MIDFSGSETASAEMTDLSKTKKCVIYARCSTTHQSESVESQVTFNRAFAMRKGLLVVGVFQDEGKTGRKADRDGLQALMKELLNPDRTWDLVLVYRIDRFFRNARLFMEYQYRLLDNHVYLLSAQEAMLNNIFPMTTTFRFFVAQQAELESNRIGENISRGKITAAQKGRWQGGQAPLGYEIVDGALTINPQQKQIIQRIFEQRSQGVSMQKIADMLNEEGYTSKRNRPFKTTSIREILTNPVYMGVCQYNRSSARGANGYNRHSLKDDELIVKSDCPAIVTEQLWMKCQPNEGNKTRSAKSTRYFLSGKVYCKECGGQVMHVNRRNNHDKLYIGFYCPNNRKKMCRTKEIDMLLLEEFVLINLCDELFSEKFIKSFAYEFPSLDGKKKSELSALKIKNKRIQKRCDNLIKRLEDNSHEEAAIQIKERLDELGKQKAELQKEISALSNSMTFMPDKKDIEKASELFIPYCKQPENRLFVESLIRTYVDRLDVDNHSVTLTLNI